MSQKRENRVKKNKCCCGDKRSGSRDLHRKTIIACFACERERVREEKRNKRLPYSRLPNDINSLIPPCYALRIKLHEKSAAKVVLTKKEPVFLLSFLPHFIL